MNESENRQKVIVQTSIIGIAANIVQGVRRLCNQLHRRDT